MTKGDCAIVKDFSCSDARTLCILQLNGLELLLGLLLAAEVGRAVDVAAGVGPHEGR